MITLTVNGDEKELDGPVSVQEFVDSFGVNLDHAAVAVNMVVLRRDELADATLDDGDRVEIVRAVGGG